MTVSEQEEDAMTIVIEVKVEMAMMTIKEEMIMVIGKIEGTERKQ